MRRLVYLIVILIASVATAYSQTLEQKREMRKGNYYFRKGEYADALKHYDAVLQQDSTSFMANFNMANTLYRQKKYGGDDAWKYISKAEELEPDNIDVLFNKGNIAIMNQDYFTAVDAFKQVLLRDPGNIEAKQNYIFAKLHLPEQDQNDQGQNGQDGQNQDKQNQDKQNQDKQDQDKQDQDKQNQDKQNQDKQNQDQDKQNQDKQNQDKQNQDNEQEGQNGGLSRQTADQLMQVIAAQDKKTQDKVNKEKVLMNKSRQNEKNW